MSNRVRSLISFVTPCSPDASTSAHLANSAFSGATASSANLEAIATTSGSVNALAVAK